ncbi:M48 family metalloprotease [Streptomyces sp. ALI-76-A]|uniref:M48 family metalloprotease n=1 Tax=Streptomyces sp. ALI-76-A TaxID=3025736 RepID=UPI00256EAAEB|nr:M48 family metalloprotease [Streptomyces sp. ALI-76-A]MDL5206516.1 M48 family metalloprotease [Streptomyces sp. ALI-76-A]
MTTAPAGAPAPALSPDPFALPSGTKFRFVLVVTALVGTMVFIHNLLYFTIAPDGEHAVAVYRQCAAAPPEQGSGTDGLAHAQGFLACIAPYERQKAWWILTGILLLAATAAVIYLLLPGFLVRRQRMEPLSPSDPDQAPLLERLHALCREAGLSRPPEFLVSSVHAPDARAFGRRSHHRVFLDQGTVLALGRAPGRFRGIVLHELAHLRNKDVDVTYLTMALALAFVPTGLLPLAVALLGTPPGEVLGVAWRALVLVALVALTCASVLRAREYGADARVASWGAGPGLLEALGPGTAHRAPWWRRGPLALHPPVARRADEIGCPKELFRIGFAECLAAGLAVSVAANGLLTLLWLLNRLDALDARWTIVLVCVPAALAVVGLGVWRAALLAHSTTGTPPPTALPALGLAVGLIVGQPLAPQNGIVLTDRNLWPGPAAVAWSVVLCVLVVAFVAWIARTAAVWYAVQAHPPGATWPVGQLAAAVPFAVLLSGWMLLYDTSDGLGPINASTHQLFEVVDAAAPVGPYWLWAAVEHPMMLQFTQWTPVVAAVVALWLFPVAALWRRGASPDLRWIRTVLATSLLAAGCFAVFQLVLRTALHQGVSLQERDQDGFVLAFTYWQIGVAIMLQGMAAAVTALLVREQYARLTAPFALMAAFLTGCLLTALFFGGVVLAGCVDALAIRPGTCTAALPLHLVRNTLLRILVGGFLCALMGLAAALLVLRMRSVRPAVPPPPRLPSPPRHRQLAMTVACVPAAAVLGIALTSGATGETPNTTPPQPGAPTVSSAAACRTFDGMLDPRLSPAETNAQLYEAVQLARLAGNDRLATAFQGLFTAARNQDTRAFGTRVEEIRTLCAAEGAVPRNLP